MPQALREKKRDLVRSTIHPDGDCVNVVYESLFRKSDWTKYREEILDHHKKKMEKAVPDASGWMKYVRGLLYGASAVYTGVSLEEPVKEGWAALQRAWESGDWQQYIQEVDWEVLLELVYAAGGWGAGWLLVKFARWLGGYLIKWLIRRRFSSETQRQARRPGEWP